MACYCQSGVSILISNEIHIEGGGVYTILVIGDWPVVFLVKREWAI